MSEGIDADSVIFDSKRDAHKSAECVPPQEDADAEEPKKRGLYLHRGPELNYGVCTLILGMVKLIFVIILGPMVIWARQWGFALSIVLWCFLVIDVVAGCASMIGFKMRTRKLPLPKHEKLVFSVFECDDSKEDEEQAHLENEDGEDDEEEIREEEEELNPLGLYVFKRLRLRHSLGRFVLAIAKCACIVVGIIPMVMQYLAHPFAVLLLGIILVDLVMECISVIGLKLKGHKISSKGVDRLVCSLCECYNHEH